MYENNRTRKFVCLLFSYIVSILFISIDKCCRFCRSTDFSLIRQALNEIPEVVKTGLWIGDCFIYTNSLNRLNYYVGGEIVTISHLDRSFKHNSYFLLLKLI